MSPKGLQILSFPCGQFLNQEFGTNEEILQFTESKGINFPVFSKVDVNGDKACELYKYLRVNSSLEGGPIKWNFSKFIVDKEGRQIEYYSPYVYPMKLREKILTIL